MNKEEERAREICAFCNWVKVCEDCPHREWPSGKWHDKPRWDWKMCENWRYYLRNPLVSKFRRFLCLIGVHEWYVFTDLKAEVNMVHRKCIHCNIEQEYYWNSSYSFGYWGFMNRRLV